MGKFVFNSRLWYRWRGLYDGKESRGESVVISKEIEKPRLFVGSPYVAMKHIKISKSK
jgi:hypothetical protein